MDGFKRTEDILVIGATNLEKSLDPAILRAGRFDKKIQFSYPTYKGRKEIIKHYLSKVVSYGIDLDNISKRTIGFSPADLKNLVNIATIDAVKNNQLYT